MFEAWLVLLFGLICSCNAASNREAYLLSTESLPSDLNFMPSLANGHLGYTVFGDAILMNGVYNGAGGNSKRARIPNWLNISVELCDHFGCMGSNAASNISYTMDLQEGYFRYRTRYASIGVTLEQRTYPHRYYTRALVFEVLAIRDYGTRANSPQYLKLTQMPGNASNAFDFVVLNKGGAASEDYRLLRGRTKVQEFEKFQPAAHEIYAVFSESLEEPLQVNWPVWKPEMQHRIVICIDRQQSVALKELQDVLKLDKLQLLQTHINAWRAFWEKEFSIAILGNGALELSRIVNAGIFYLASSLPSASSNQPNEPYYGLSPTGLARGNLEADYQGHNFWDTEIWMLPVVTQFGYHYGNLLFDYRFRHLEGARYNANATGYKGARFPWESAYTGTEVTNPCCPEVAQQEIHISPDIVFAMQKHFAQSHDNAWLCEHSWPIVADVAEFLLNRASCEASQGPCHFRNVMGPDEDHANVDDNVYTNAVAKIALDFAAWTGERCGVNNTELYKKWRDLKDRLVILHDTTRDYHPQHLGYELNAIVKQADTILLGYPLQFDTSSTHLNDLHYYANVTRESGPAMTWSMFAANYLATSEDWRAAEYFTRGYQSYVRPEFKVWSETPIGYEGSANFLTGIGGFLQALIFGYGGINFARVNQTLQLQLHNPHVPPNVEQVLIRYIRFAQCKCSWTFSYQNSTLDCQAPMDQRFELVQGDKHTQLGSDFSVTLNRGDAPLYVKVVN